MGRGPRLTRWLGVQNSAQMFSSGRERMASPQAKSPRRPRGPSPKCAGLRSRGAQTPRASGAPTRCRPLAGAAAVLTDQHALLTQ